MDKATDIPDGLLLQAISQGDEQAFNALFARYRNRLYNYFVKSIKSPEAAEEMALDAFLKIWTARHVLHEIANFEAFLFRVAHNRSIDFLRQAQRSRKAQEEIWKEMSRLTAPASDELILKADTERAIRQAVNQLSPQRQEVFRLSREEHLSYDEIAERMQLSRLTVRNHLSAALSFIRTHLDNGPGIAGLMLLLTSAG